MASLGRPVWTGQIRLSLVALPVKLYTATESRSTLTYHQIHEPSGKRVRYEKTVPSIGPINKDDIVRGYEYESGKYVLLSDEEIAAVKLDAKKTIELVQFVDHCEIDPIYFDRPYYVVPDGDLAEDAFRVVRDALRRKRKVGLGQVVMRGREYIAAVKPCGKGMLLETIRFENELRRSETYFEGIADTRSDRKLVALAEELIERQAGPFRPGVFEDRYSAALQALVQAKVKGRRTVAVQDEDAEPGRGGEVVDLMEALKKSLGSPGATGNRRSGGGSGERKGRSGSRPGKAA